MRRRTLVTAMAAAALALGLAACSPPGPGEIEVVEEITDLEYYYACGNEVLRLEDGRLFYPLLPEDQTTFDSEPYAAGGILVSEQLAAVMPPGPGDDTGTLSIYSDGMALWEPDSGGEVWLQPDPVELLFVC